MYISNNWLWDITIHFQQIVISIYKILINYYLLNALDINLN